jgi:hypothetical protein
MKIPRRMAPPEYHPLALRYTWYRRLDAQLLKPRKPGRLVVMDAASSQPTQANSCLDSAVSGAHDSRDQYSLPHSGRLSAVQ